MVEHTTPNDSDWQSIAPDDWLRVLEDDYLDDFISSGGSAVKFVSGTPDVLGQVREHLGRAAGSRSMHCAMLDPGVLRDDTKKPELHRMDRLFLALTSAVDWKHIARKQVRTYLENAGIRVDGFELDDLESIAAANGRLESDLLSQYQRELATPQLRDRQMAVEFRTALTALQRAQIVPESMSPTTEDVLLGWLRGRTMPGAASVLKKIQIYERITQGNARHMLVSFCHWLGSAGLNGVVAILDFRPYEHKRPTRGQANARQVEALKSALGRGASSEELLRIMDQPPEPEAVVHYSDKAYVQMLALLRRFIDDIDLFKGFLLVVLTSPSFYDATSPRNYNNYDALQTRIGLEVRDIRKANPAAALVHLAEKS